MQAGDYDPFAEIPDPVVRRIFVNGIYRPHVQDSWSAEIASDLPDQVSGVTGIRARTGSVTFSPHQTVTTEAPSPLQRAEGWPPQRGDTLTIQDEAFPQRWTRATARISDVRAGLGAGEVEVEWTDDLDSSLSSPTTLPPVASGMPGEEVNVGGELRRYMARTGIEPWGIVVSALHDAGYRLLPSVSDVDFFALMQGNLHPRIGRVAAANKSGNVLEWDNDSGFQYVSEWAEFTPGYEGRTTGDCFTVYLRKTRGGPDAQTRWTMGDGSEIRITLQNSSVAMSRNGTVIAQRGFTGTSPLPWVGASIALDRTTLWVEGQELYTVIHEPRFEPWSVLEWERVRVIGAAALQVSYVPLTGWPGFNWPSLRFRAAGPGLVRETDCTRTIEDTPVRDVLSDIAKATLTGFWLDEHGTLQWMPSIYLENQAPVQTITTRFDVLSGSWTETGGGVASTIVTKYQDAAITTKPVVGVNVGDSSGGRTLSAGDVQVDWVGPGTDEEWIEPDMTPLPAGQNTYLMAEEAKQSWWGGSYVATKGENPESTTYGWANLPFGQNYMTCSVSNVTPRRWKVTQTVRSGAPQVQLVTLPNSSGLPIPWRDYPLPIWRARGLVSYVKASVTYRRGPDWAPSYEHDIGAWGSRNDAHRIGDYLADRMSTIQVVLSRLGVVPDPRRQLGDVYEVNASGVLGGAVRVMVVGIHESSTAAGIEQELDLRVIRATPEVRKIYADIESTTAPYSGIESGTAPYSDLEA